MKKIFLLLLLVIPVFAIAQEKQQSNSEEFSADSINRIRLEIALDNIFQYWQFGYNTHPPTFDFAYSKFTRFLTDSAQFINDLNIVYKPSKDRESYPYKPLNLLDTQNVDYFAKTIKDSYESLQIDTIKVSAPVFNSGDSTVVDTIYREISGTAKIASVLRDFEIVLDTLINRRNVYYVSRKKLLKSHLSLMTDTTPVYQGVRTNLDSLVRIDSGKVLYTFKITDKIILKMKLTRDTCSDCQVKLDTMLYRITHMYLDGEPLIICENDLDNDGLTSDSYTKNVDKCREFGDFTTNGCPDYDFDKTPDGLDKCKDIFGLKDNCGCPRNFFNARFSHEMFIGGQFNSVPMNLPELNELGYRSDGNEAIDVLQSQKGTLNDQGSRISMMIGANLNAFFGRQRNMGISLGLTYSFFNATYTVGEPIVYTFKSFDGKDYYRRRVNINQGSSEKISYNILNIPLLFKCRWMNKNIKWQYQFGIGPSFIMFRNASSYDVRIDFEGLYQIDINHKPFPAITYEDYFDPTSNLNVYVVGDSISSNSAIAAAVLDSLNSRGYDFATGKRYEGKQSKLKRNSIAINIIYDVSYKLNDNFALKLGFHFVYAPLLADSKNYIPIDKTGDDYNSLYNGKAKSHYFAYGINAGFIFNID